MAMSAKPTILFACGAWHPPHAYAPLPEQLERLGHEIVIPRLATLGADKVGLSWAVDVAVLLEAAETLFEAGKEVVLVGHSYGGIPATIATRDHSVSDRKRQGKKGGFVGIVFLAAFAVPVKGWDLLRTFGGEWSDWQNSGEKYTKNKIISLNDKAKHILYNDCPADIIEALWPQLEPHSQDALETPVEFIAADITIPRGYIICKQDLALPAALQEQLVEALPGMKVARINASHSPFLSRPEEAAEILAGMVKQLVDG